jgi:hypothetical protein
MEEIAITDDKKMENHLEAVWYFIHDYNAQLAKVSAITTTIKSLPSGFTLRKFPLPDYNSKAS